MRIENLKRYPMQLDDERVIGAAGTKDAVREYGLDKLGKNDQHRVKANQLHVIEEPSAAAADTDSGRKNEKEKK